MNAPFPRLIRGRSPVVGALLLSMIALACGTENPGDQSSTGGAPSVGDASGGAPSATGGTSPGGGGTASSGGQSSGAGGAIGDGGAGTGGAMNTGGSSAGGTMNSGGGTGDGGNGSGGQSGAYQPCPESGDCKILPLGDSITWGVGDEPNGGYRGPLFAHFVADGKKATFTGSGQNGPSMVSGVAFPKRNEGHSGWGIAQVTEWSGGNAGIAQQIPSPAFDTNSGGIPNIILLHIGTNDANEFTANVMEADLNKLLDKIVAGAPDALIVLAKIIPMGWTNQELTNYNAKLAGIVSARADEGQHIVLVDLNTGFNTESMLVSDDLHPNSTGFKFMADKWYEVISPFLH